MRKPGLGIGFVFSFWARVAILNLHPVYLNEQPSLLSLSETNFDVICCPRNAMALSSRAGSYLVPLD